MEDLASPVQGLQKQSYVPRPPATLYYHESMKPLAQSIAERCSQPSVWPKVAEGQFVQCVKMVHIDWDKFPDGWPNLNIQNLKQDCAGKDVIFLGSFHSPEVVFEELSVLYKIPRSLARSFTFILPYFPTGTMEREDTEGQIATAKTLATLLSAIPLTARGPSQIVIFDIHALQERFYFGDNVIPRLESAIPLLMRELKKLNDNLSIAFPDEGAFKRFHTMFTAFPNITCIKIRNGNTRSVEVKEGDPKDHHVVIIDDLVMTGGTLIQCAKALEAAGASKISAYVTHAVFPKQSWKKFTECDVPFEKFYITDSLPHSTEIAKEAPFELLSLCDVISDTLLGFDLLQT
ncbi:ribose-phosphate pyrophosphokinase 4-like [Actinia tenebrosa]|uniref:Ribose-phosphate pyrophosphokinase 4-like n=1 Tax=Actinia tenebrosa TaxID=6105 RepID=A0A6P8J9A0_ACTTE|nr:ribose-phosphate pyrophosphokinase 4-like [Actinia tenebrosa]